MKCYEITLKSGTKVVVFAKAKTIFDLLKKEIEHLHLVEDEVASITELSENIRNQVFYLREHKSPIAERAVAEQEMKDFAEERYKDLHPQVVTP